MVLKYHHTIPHPITGEVMDVMYDEDGNSDPLRDAQRRSSYYGPVGRSFAILQNRSERRPAQRPQLAGGRPATTASAPVAASAPSTAPARDDGEYVAIRKEAVASLLPIIGELCAAYLGRPDMPRPTGDHNTDFTNEALHRDALASHSQQRDRIRAIAGLAERAAKLMLS